MMRLMMGLAAALTVTMSGGTVYTKWSCGPFPFRSPAPRVNWTSQPEAAGNSAAAATMNQNPALQSTPRRPELVVKKVETIDAEPATVSSRTQAHVYRLRR